MAKKPDVRIVLTSVAAVLLTALALQAGSAQERSGERARPSLGQPSALARAKARHARTQEGKTIDTPISVLRHGPGSRDGVRGAQNIFRIVPTDRSRTHVTAPGSNVVRRNAIGLQVTPRLAFQGHNARSLARQPAQLSSAAASGIGPFAHSSPGGQRTVALGGSASFTISSRAGIGGAVLTRRSEPLSGLGGPARALAGINGSTIRPKR